MDDEKKVRHEWSKGTTYRQGRERSLGEYEGFLGFERDELDGKRVLDIGSGETERFSRELDNGKGGEVVSLNPDYVDERLRKVAQQNKEWRQTSVAGIAQELPFPSESFDVVLGLYSVTAFASPNREDEDARMWSKEVSRVLRAGGRAMFAPIMAFDEASVKEDYVKEIEVWESRGLHVKIEQMTEKDLGLSDDANKGVAGFFRIKVVKPERF